MDKNLIQLVENKVIDTLLLAQEKLKQNFEIPIISFNLKSSRIAGLAYRNSWMIKINPAFLERFTEKTLIEVVPHEITHLLTYKLFPFAKQHHGPEWRNVNMRMGLALSRCHSMVLPEHKPYAYKCSCQTHFVSNIIRKRISEGQRITCRKCKSGLVYLGKNINQ